MSNERKRQALIDAIAESERFTRTGKKALKSFEKRTGYSGRTWLDYDSPLYAAAKRASMDATRALAAFRKGEPR